MIIRNLYAISLVAILFATSCENYVSDQEIEIQSNLIYIDELIADFEMRYEIKFSEIDKMDIYEKCLNVDEADFYEIVFNHNHNTH